MPLKAISFDAAGTLIDVREPVGTTYGRLAAQHGLQIDPQSLKTAFRTAWSALPDPLHPEDQPPDDDDRSWWHTLVTRVFTEASGAPVPASQLDPLFHELYAYFAQAEAWTVYEDVIPALTDLAQDHRLIILSNFDRRLHTILAGHGLAPFFESVILSSEVGASKPHPRMFAAALRATNCLPHECLHIGDDAKCDITGATSHGIHAFQITRPGSGMAEMIQKVRSEAYSGLHVAQKSIPNPPHPRG